MFGVNVVPGFVCSELNRDRSLNSSADFASPVRAIYVGWVQVSTKVARQLSFDSVGILVLGFWCPIDT